MAEKGTKEKSFVRNQPITFSVGVGHPTGIKSFLRDDI